MSQAESLRLRLQGTSSRVVLVGICAWISVCLLIAGWLPEINGEASTIWLISGLMGLVSAVGLAETIKSDMRMQACLLDQYRLAALTDGLTHVANRIAFDAELQQTLKKSQLRKRPLALVMIDIDHFKAFNDQWGHQAGDAVLRSVAQHMSQLFRTKGFLARYGGEEFSVILPDATLLEAERLAEACRRHIRDAEFTFQDRNFRVTISCGLAEATATETPDSLTQRADHALYAAKAEGRDRVHASGRPIDCRLEAVEAPPQIEARVTVASA